MKTEAEGGNKTVKHCEICRENFGNGFSFCPVCGEPLKTVEVGPSEFAAALTVQTAARIEPEEETVTVLNAAPLIDERSFLSISQLAVESENESSDLPENQRGLQENASNASSGAKFVIPIKQPEVKAISLRTPVSKKFSNPSLVVAVAIIVAILLGATLELSENQTLSSEATNLKVFPSAPSPQIDSAVETETLPESVDKETLPQTLASVAPAQPAVLETTSSEKVENPSGNEKRRVAASSQLVPRENGKEAKPSERSQTLPRMALNSKPSAGLAVREEIFNQPRQAVFRETLKDKPRKRSGFKSFFSKIGSGVLYLPRMIFKRKKR